jgi:hypothetical protein
MRCEQLVDRMLVADAEGYGPSFEAGVSWRFDGEAAL